MSNIKVSVIMPCYNASSTITKVLGPIVHQTLTDIEIILINDASTDQTLSILSECQRQFPNIVKVINSDKNLGPGGARNLGLDMASGEYITFIDSDDYVSDEILEKMYTVASTQNCDIVECGMYVESSDTAQLIAGDNVCGELTSESRSTLISFGGYLCGKLIKRTLWENPRIRMRENCSLEDAEIMPYMFATAKRIGNVKEILYSYNNSESSLSKVNDYDKYYNNHTRALQAIYHLLSPLKNYEEIREATECMMTEIYVHAILSIYERAYYDKSFDPMPQLQELQKIYQQTVKTNYKENKYCVLRLTQDALNALAQIQNDLS